MQYLGFTLIPLVDSSYLLVVSIIDYYSESLCGVLFHMVHARFVPRCGPYNLFMRVLPNIWHSSTPFAG
jgi:hypothetical protein